VIFHSYLETDFSKSGIINCDGYCIQVFRDLGNIICGSNIPLTIDKDLVLGRGGTALVLKGELSGNPVSYFTSYIRDVPKFSIVVTTRDRVEMGTMGLNPSLPIGDDCRHVKVTSKI